MVVKASPSPKRAAMDRAISGPATTSVNAASTNTASATVMAIAFRRTFHHGRPSSMS